MRYDFTLPTEDHKHEEKKQNKTEDSGIHTLLQSAHADMSAREIR